MIRRTLAFSLLVFAGASTFAQEPEEPVIVWARDPYRLALPGGRGLRSMPLVYARLTTARRRALRADPNVVAIYPDREYRTSLVPAIAVSEAPALWDAGYLGRSESVAIVDTGIDAAHPMFQGLRIESKVFLASGVLHPCFGDDAATPNDLQGHGTRTASIIAGQSAPLFPGYFGAARGIGAIYALKAGFKSRPGADCPGAEGILRASDIFDAIEYAVTETPARIINISVGGIANFDDDLLSQVLDFFASRHGVTFTVSAGNNGTEAGVNSPGIAHNVLTIANLDDRGTLDKRDDVIHPTSSRGPTFGQRSKPDLAAPGTRILGAVAGTEVLNPATGTSSASPVVAGVAALLRDAGVRDQLSLKALLLNSTDGPGTWQRDSGWGTINAATAFEQRPLVFKGKGPMTFRGVFAEAGARATLVWNRRIGVETNRPIPSLATLSMEAFRRDGSSVVRVSSGNDNVLALRFETAGEYVVRVDASRNENWALAFSQAGITPASGAKLDFHCTHPNPVRAGLAFTITCTAVNTGDLDLRDITGIVAPPTTFSTGGPQSFGNLAPGVSRSSTWTLIAPSAASAYSIAFAASATSYTQAVDAPAGSLMVDVAKDAPLLALDPSVVLLTPARPIATLRAAGAMRELRTSAAWLRAEAVSGEIRLSLAEASRSFAAGQYTAEFFATPLAGGEPVRGRAILTVTGPSPSMDSARISVNPAMSPGCAAPEIANRIAEPAWAGVRLWFRARGVRAGDSMFVRWTAPDGRIAANTALVMPGQDGDYCFAAAPPPFSQTGVWQAEAFWNGAAQGPVRWTATRAPELQSAVACGPGVGVCAVFRDPPEVRYEFVNPQGEVEARQAEPIFENGRTKAGDWRIRVIADGVVAGEVIVTVAAPVEITQALVEQGQLILEAGGPVNVEFRDPEGKRVAGQANAASGRIALPESGAQGRWEARLSAGDVLLRVIPFDRLPVTVNPNGCGSNALVWSALDRLARFTVGLGGAGPGDWFRFEFLREGAVYARSPRIVLPPAGGCVTGTMPVAGAEAARLPGKWTARVLVNDVQVAAQDFEIRSAAKLVWAPVKLPEPWAAGGDIQR